MKQFVPKIKIESIVRDELRMLKESKFVDPNIGKWVWATVGPQKGMQGKIIRRQGPLVFVQWVDGSAGHISLFNVNYNPPKPIQAPVQPTAASTPTQLPAQTAPPILAPKKPSVAKKPLKGGDSWVKGNLEYSVIKSNVTKSGLAVLWRTKGSDRWENSMEVMPTDTKATLAMRVATMRTFGQPAQEPQASKGPEVIKVKRQIKEMSFSQLEGIVRDELSSILAS